ncbi:MAG: DNA cytosine methyltransferase, partial [Candidatus Hydrogenedentes bacterium]|nr:DNA cytosine methyltransferase [Candidatus Hydrogenedentota bacterium]
SVTVKREASHTGNGRYAHPVQNRLCSVRGMSILQGFPETYCFEANPLSNTYRHVGDAVPPLISFQIAAVCEWILTGVRPNLHDVILPDTHLSIDDIVPEELIPKQPKLPNFA